MDHRPPTGFFSYNRGQQVVLVLLGLGILLFAGLANLYPYAPEEFSPDPELIAKARSLLKPVSEERPDKLAESFFFNPNTVTEDELVRLGLRPDQAGSWIRYRGDRKQTFKRPEDIARLYKLDSNDVARLLPLIKMEEAILANKVAERESKRKDNTSGPAYATFSFDPNTVTEAELKKLGLSERQASGFVRYRAKAGPFRSAADLEKLRLLNDEAKARLLPLVRIEAATSTVADVTEKGNDGPIAADNQTAATVGTYGNSVAQPEAYRPSSNYEPAAVAINTATLADLMELPGIGEYRAGKILRFRELLGGFTTVAQFGTTRGLPDSVFQRIEPYLVLESPPQAWLKVNSLSVDAMAGHPYLSKKKARAIVRYRENHGQFADRDALEKVLALKPSDIDRLEPYLSYE
ncbi:hypothetical protein CEQ90_02125 [Lewinellaceae bacterium SD302]|nr:hypothetical protein CEQ90_02125 [Lewinellaceae bacterium SD302]